MSTAKDMSVMLRSFYSARATKHLPIAVSGGSSGPPNWKPSE